MKTLTPIACLIAALLAGCVEKPPQTSVAEFMENPRLLEAAIVRCAADRRLRYEVEYVNARDASSRLQAAAERERRDELERQSELKRKALREAREAQAAAERRALEEEKLREKREHDDQFDAIGEEPPPEPATKPGSQGQSEEG